MRRGSEIVWGRSRPCCCCSVPTTAAIIDSRWTSTYAGAGLEQRALAAVSVRCHVIVGDGYDDSRRCTSICGLLPKVKRRAISPPHMVWL